MLGVESDFVVDRVLKYVYVIYMARKLRTYKMPKKDLKTGKNDVKRQLKINNFSFNYIFNEYNKMIFKKYKILLICNIYCEKNRRLKCCFFHTLYIL